METTPTGELTPSGRKYVSGTAVELNAASLSGYVFASWEGDVTGETTPKTITMNSNKNIIARFKILIPASYTLNISISPLGSGTVTPSSGPHSNGDIVAITAEANSGYVFASWEGDLNGSVNPTTITMNGNKNITATFILDDKIHGDYTGCGIGAVPCNGLPNEASIEAYETMIGRGVAVVSFFRDFTYPFPASTCNTIHNHHGSIPMITWEPWRWNSTDTTYSLDHIIAGDCDAYIKSFAEAAKAWGGHFFLRFAQEMDGDWYPWSGSQNGSNEAATAKYKAAWMRIHATFEALGVNNVTWVWCPNQYYLPHEDWNSPEAYYPGDDYVDWAATDGYSSPWSSCESFDVIFGDIYSKLTSLTSNNKPVMIAEMARSTEETHGGKPAWMSDAFDKIKSASYGKIKLYIWFNIDNSTVGQWDWRIESSASSEAMMHYIMTSEASYYLSTIH